MTVNSVIKRRKLVSLSIAGLLFSVLFFSGIDYSLADISSPSRGRIVDNELYKRSSAIDLVKSQYGDLLKSNDGEESTRRELRLAIALKMYDSTFKMINPVDGNGSSRYLPSPQALLRIESMLDAIDENCSGSDAEYVNGIRQELNTIGSPAENELIQSVVSDMNANKETIEGLNELSLPEQPATDESGENENSTSSITDTVTVPSDEPDTITNDDDPYEVSLLSGEVEETSTEDISESEISTWTDEELNDRIAALLALGETAESQPNLSTMEEIRNNRIQTATEAGGTVSAPQTTPPIASLEDTPETGETTVSEADLRANEIDSSMGHSGSMSLIDSALANMTDFFHTDKESDNSEDSGTGIYDPLTSKELSEDEVKNMDIMDNFDTELVQGDQDEAVSERNVSN